jgi:hypothetical protein
MSADLIARAKAALEGVTEGPWVVEESHTWETREPNVTYHLVDIERAYGGYRNNVYCGTDKTLAQFIAAARSLLPELIAALERRPLVPIVDDLASERLDGLRDERDELLVRVDELAEEIAELRRQLPDYEATS